MQKEQITPPNQPTPFEEAMRFFCFPLPLLSITTRKWQFKGSMGNDNTGLNRYRPLDSSISKSLLRIWLYGMAFSTLHWYNVSSNRAIVKESYKVEDLKKILISAINHCEQEGEGIKWVELKGDIDKYDSRSFRLASSVVLKAKLWSNKHFSM